MALNFFNRMQNLFAGEDGHNSADNSNLFEQPQQPQVPEVNWREKAGDFSNQIGRLGARLGSMDTVYGNNFKQALNDYQEQDRLDFMKQQMGAKAEARTDTDKMRNVEYLVSQGMDRNKAVDMVFGSKANTVVNVNNGKMSPFEESLQKESAKDVVKNLTELKQISGDTNKTISAIASLKDNLKDNKEIVGPYAGARATLGNFTGGVLGFDREQLQKRGDAARSIASMKNSLIAEAKNQGQTGINTAREIEMATAGLDENSSYEQINGALTAMERAAKDLQRIKEANVRSQLGAYSQQFGDVVPMPAQQNKQDKNNDPLGLR